MCTSIQVVLFPFVRSEANITQSAFLYSGSALSTYWCCSALLLAILQFSDFSIVFVSVAVSGTVFFTTSI